MREDQSVEHEARPAPAARPSSGPARVLVAVYAVFALAAGARAAVQLSTRFSEAPVAYLLSALAAVVYIAATVGLARGGRGGRRLAFVAITTELVGVLLVPPAGVLWARAEPSRWAGTVLAVAGVVVAVMAWRLLQIWEATGA